MQRQETNASQIQFLHAAKHGNLKRVREYIKINKENPEFFSASNEYGQTALMLALSYDHFHTAKALLPILSINNINAADDDGRTALHIAAKKGHIEIVRLLLTIDCTDYRVNDYSAQINNHRIASEIAALYNHQDIVTLINDEIKKQFLNAAKNGLFNKIKGYIASYKDNPAFFSVTDENGNTALTLSILYGKIKIASLLYPFCSADVINVARTNHGVRLRYLEAQFGYPDDAKKRESTKMLQTGMTLFSQYNVQGEKPAASVEEKTPQANTL